MHWQNINELTIANCSAKLDISAFFILQLMKYRMFTAQKWGKAHNTEIFSSLH